MSQNAPFALNDAASSPVSHTFNPISSQNGVVTYRDIKVYENPAERSRISASLRAGSIGNSVTRVGRIKRKCTIKVVVPFIPSSTWDSAPASLDTVEAELKVSVPLDADAQVVDDLLAYVTQALSVEPLASMVTEGEFPY